MESSSNSNNQRHTNIFIYISNLLTEPQSSFTIVNVASSTQCLCNSTESGSYSVKFAVKYWVSYLPDVQHVPAPHCSHYRDGCYLLK